MAHGLLEIHQQLLQEIPYPQAYEQPIILKKINQYFPLLENIREPALATRGW